MTINYHFPFHSHCPLVRFQDDVQSFSVELGSNILYIVLSSIPVHFAIYYKTIYNDNSTKESERERLQAGLVSPPTQTEFNQN